jgi:hypothetical protein
MGLKSNSEYSVSLYFLQLHSGLNQFLESVDQEAAPGMLISPGPGLLKTELYVFWYYIIINMVNEQGDQAHSILFLNSEGGKGFQVEKVTKVSIQLAHPWAH